MALVFDIETNGFLESVTTLHCLVIKNTDTGEVAKYPSKDFPDIEIGLRVLMMWTNEGGNTVAGHNVIKYDIPVIQKLYPWFSLEESKVIDTLVLSRLIFSDLRDKDGLHIEQGLLPTKLWGSHSLKAWGYRLGVLKGDFGGEQDSWDVFTPEMLEYCAQDVEVTHTFYEKLMGLDYSKDAIELEHKTAWICARMEQNGWAFDVQKASELYAELAAKRDAHLRMMQEVFEPIVIERVSEKTGKPLKPKIVEFNPSSRQQIAERLTTKYGWKPKDFTPAGQPKVDEEILSKLDYPEAKKLAEYFMLEKRIGQIGEGDQAWLKLERGGVIHGSINTNGAVTGRCTHQAPNLAQVPSVRSPYGKECRALFGVRQGFSLVGADLSGLELRCLAHFMARWDDGEYGNEVLNGDVHTKNQLAAGLPTRDNAKTFIYAFLYGGGDAKIGSIVGKSSQVGRQLKESFLDATPALKNLRQAVQKAAARGHLIGLDGRRLAIRSAHAALNTLLQSAGALISKQWLIETYEEAIRRGLRYGPDFELKGYIHDELQWEVRDELADDFGKMACESATRAGEHFAFRCRIDAEYKIGRTWYDTH
jgi:DNA polymerase I